jgi:hypothetical protein
VETYLTPVTLTTEETTKIKGLEEEAAPAINEPNTHRAATAALHKAIVAVLTDEQRATLKKAHAR